jgi:hypothetical protein
MPKLTQSTTVEVEVEPRIIEEAETKLRLYKELKAELERVKDELGALVTEAGVNLNLGKEIGSVGQVPAGETTKLNKKKLVALGVKMSLIEQATLTTPRKPYIVVRVPGDPEPTDE